MRAQVPVDLLNPGQVFACLGLAELVESISGFARAGFDWSDPLATRFVLESNEDSNPVEAALGFLLEAEVLGEAPPRPCFQAASQDPDADALGKKWKVALQRRDGQEVYSIPRPDSLATWPALLIRGEHRVVIDHWGDEGTGRDRVKFWAGSGGIPGARLMSDALELLREAAADEGSRSEMVRDPFDFARAQSSSFRFDWRRDYVPIDAGFSPNYHSAITSVGYPLVEALAAIGLSHARPDRPDPRNKLLYRYGVLGATDDQLLPLPLLRAGLGARSPVPFPSRSFRIHLDWPGQEGQARCITHTIEEL